MPFSAGFGVAIAAGGLVGSLRPPQAEAMRASTRASPTEAANGRISSSQLLTPHSTIVSAASCVKPLLLACSRQVKIKTNGTHLHLAAVIVTATTRRGDLYFWDNICFDAPKQAGDELIKRKPQARLRTGVVGLLRHPPPPADVGHGMPCVRATSACR